MKIWQWWPIRLWKWLTGYTGGDCSLGVGVGPSKEQPFRICMFDPNKKTFFWMIDLTEKQFIGCIENMQSSLDQYQIFRRDNHGEPKPNP